MAKTTGLIKVKKGDESLDINPRMLAQHQALGWVLVDDDMESAMSADAQAAKEKAEADEVAAQEKAAADNKAAVKKAEADAKAAQVKAAPQSRAAAKQAELDAEVAQKKADAEAAQRKTSK
jgi:colicin import membrane protein